MSINWQWFRSLFGLPSKNVETEERGKLDRLPDDWYDREPDSHSTTHTRENFDRLRAAAEYRRARRRELDAYEEGIHIQQQADVIGDLIAYNTAQEAIEDAEDRADRAEERVEDARQELVEERAEHHVYEPQPDNTYQAVYEAPEPVYETPAQPEYQAPEPSYPEPSNDSTSGEDGW